MNICILYSYLFIKRMRKTEGECRKYIGSFPSKSQLFQLIWTLLFSSYSLKLLELKNLWVSVYPTKHIQHFSNAWKWKVKVKSLSHVRLLVTSWTAAYQLLCPWDFSRQEYWTGVRVHIHNHIIHTYICISYIIYEWAFL